VGRYRRAYKRYNRAIEVINELLKKKKDPGDIKYDVHADYAEFLIYMGGPKIALGYLKANLPKDKELGWHAWVRAFAIHQRAFSDRFPFGSVAKNEPGEKATYVASNKLIDDTLNLKKYKLADSERCDIHLLKAANFGAMIRIDPNDATAIKGAADALSFFSSGPGADPVNKKWSWQKERRGRFMKVHRPLSDNGLFGNKNKSRVEAWRDLYEMHFRENLCAAGLPLTAGDTDGEVDLIEDHLDDDDT
jgi:glycosyltransferase involved in cell wall biosynthesis